jgi:hypothetical protein
MLRSELTDEDATRILAGHARNMVAAPGVTFSPWRHLDLSYQDGMLCLVQGNGVRSLFPVEEVYGSTDEELAQRILKGIGQ